jgi:hypothetical protein
MRPFIGKILLHRITISFLNISLLILAYSALKATWINGTNSVREVHEAVELWEGFGTILLGFGVALEERDSLKKIATFDETTPEQVDHVCHDYGVLFVMLGVIIEAFAWLVKLPNAVLDTEGVEFVLLQCGALTAVIGVYLQIKFQYHLWKPAPTQPKV